MVMANIDKDFIVETKQLSHHIFLLKNETLRMNGEQQYLAYHCS